MTNTEIKKAFEQFKRELKKETGISGGFTMSAKQIANRTATYLVCNLIPFETEIRFQMNSIESVRGYKSWTDAEKNRWISDAEATIKEYENLIAQYGTKEAFAKAKVDKVVESKSFARFVNAVGNVDWHMEAKCSSGLDLLYLRINY